MNRIEIEQLRAKLLVEGNDDFHVVSAICQQFDVAPTFGIIDSKGIDKLLPQISVRVKLREPFIGILVDADTDLTAKWQQLQSILTPLGYNMSSKPELEGTITRSEISSTIIGIWIMPDNQVPGMLEDFARILIPKGDALLPFAEKIVDEVMSMETAKIKAVHRSKAIIHTWLAWQESPGTPMGLAITKTYLNHNHELCLMFVAWLNRLFNSESA